MNGGIALGPRRGSIGAAARAAGLEFGAAVRFDRIDSDDRLHDTILAQCASVTPEFDMNWDTMEPEPGAYRLGPMDDLAAFAEDRGLTLRGHTLLWDLATPNWARERIARGDWALVEYHLRTVMQRYPQIAEWEVVNEALDTEEGQDGLRRTSFLQGFGPGYLERAFRTARDAAPKARLLLNDYSLEYDNPIDAARRAKLIDLAAMLRSAGVLDGVGIQAHLDLAKGEVRAATLGPFLRELADMGLSIVITELDVKEADRNAPLAVRDQRVADAARAFLDIALDQPAVTGVHLWGITDRDSWLQEDQFAANRDGASLNRGLPFDARLAAKPMASAIREAMRMAGVERSGRMAT